jgi:hypothetical protein
MNNLAILVIGASKQLGVYKAYARNILEILGDACNIAMIYYT